MTGKVVRFLRHPLSADRWTGLVGRPGAPTRVALGTALDLPGLPPPPFAAVEVLWFDADADAGIGPTAADGTVVVPVHEVVLRGADALAARWADGGDRFKMMSFGRRSPVLTRSTFLERWRAEAGRLAGDRIPDQLRGLAYVQDHPRGDEPAFDAINEVWFERLDDLRRRAEWFAARPPPAELMSPTACWSVCLRETVVGTR